MLPDEERQAYVERLARAKASGFDNLRTSGSGIAPVLAADTTVALGSQILGKPADPDDAIALLTQS